LCYLLAADKILKASKQLQTICLISSRIRTLL
jgi:hypothetical protein